MKKTSMNVTFMSALALSIALLSAPNAAQSDIYKVLQKKDKKHDKNNESSGETWDPAEAQRPFGT